MESRFFERFTELCNKTNETPTYVGRLVGASSGTVSGWRSGRVPHSSTVAKIAEHFNVTVDYLMGKEPTSNQINRTIVERAELFAAVKNISLANVEAKAGLKSGEIKSWEFQQTTPDFNVLVDIAEELGTSVPYLMGTTKDPAPLPKEKAPTQTGERSDDELTMQIIEALKNADKEQREAILTLLTRK